MAPRVSSSRPILQPTHSPPQAANLEQDITRIDGMNVDALRVEWRRVFGTDPPPAFSKDLLSRAIANRLQELALGAVNPSTSRLLRSLLKPGAEPPRQVKIGSVIVREHRGIIHEVLVTPDGFCWRGKTYDSLSTVAKKITGVTWNGPRFFGLRSSKPAVDQAVPVASANVPPAPGSNNHRPAGRRSSLRSPSKASGVRP